MAYADTLRSALFTGGDIATLIEGIGVSGYPLTWSTWTPTMGATGSMTYTSTSIRYANYIAIGTLRIISVRVDGTIGGSVSTGVTITLPTATASTTYDQFATGRIYVNGAGEAGVIGLTTASTTATFYRYATGSNWVAGTASVSGNFIYYSA